MRSRFSHYKEIRVGDRRARRLRMIPHDQGMDHIYDHIILSAAHMLVANGSSFSCHPTITILLKAQWYTTELLKIHLWTN